MRLSEDVTFLNKASIQQTLAKVPDNTILEIDASHSYFIHHDVMEIIEDFQVSAANRNIEVRTIGLFNDKEDDSKKVEHFDLLAAEVE